MDPVRPIALSLLVLVTSLLAPLARSAVDCGSGGALFRSGFEACDARRESGFVYLEQDRFVTGPVGAVVLAHRVRLERATEVLVVADGRQFPLGGARGRLSIEVDGEAVPGSASVIDWRESSRRVQHAFRVLAHMELPAGEHAIGLRAAAGPAEDDRFGVGSGSGLGVLVAPHSALASTLLVGESEPVDAITYRPVLGIDVNEGNPDRPWARLLEGVVSNDGAEAATAVALVAGHARHACRDDGDRFGDALWGLWIDDACPVTDTGAWSVNDIDPRAELQAPMGTHAAWPLGPRGEVTFSWGATELAFGSDQASSPAGAHENQVCYRAGDALLLTALGGPVSGTGEPVGPPEPCATYTWRCVASTEGSPGCPEAGTWVVLTGADVFVPPGHDGQVYFSAVTRIQGDSADGFTTARLRLRVDGRLVGSTGVQQLDDGVAQASRTLTASWLSAADSPDGALEPGLHRVEAVIRVTGDRLRFVSVPRDLSLIHFD